MVNSPFFPVTIKRWLFYSGTDCCLWLRWWRQHQLRNDGDVLIFSHSSSVMIIATYIRTTYRHEYWVAMLSIRIGEKNSTQSTNWIRYCEKISLKTNTEIKSLLFRPCFYYSKYLTILNEWDAQKKILVFAKTKVNFPCTVVEEFNDARLGHMNWWE